MTIFLSPLVVTAISSISKLKMKPTPILLLILQSLSQRKSAIPLKTLLLRIPVREKSIAVLSRKTVCSM